MATLTIQDVQRLRQQTSDDALFNQLYSGDQEFKRKVDNVRTANPSMTPFEKVKFPSAMIDIHVGNTYSIAFIEIEDNGHVNQNEFDVEHENLREFLYVLCEAPATVS